MNRHNRQRRYTSIQDLKIGHKKLFAEKQASSIYVRRVAGTNRYRFVEGLYREKITAKVDTDANLAKVLLAINTMLPEDKTGWELSKSIKRNLFQAVLV